MAKYEIGDEFANDWNRVRSKVDGISGVGVRNTRDSITINIPPSNGGTGKDGEDSSAAGEEWFIARVSGSSQDGSNKRWIYTFVELSQSAAGYGNFTDKTGGRTGDAYNVIEAFNGSSGTFGNGVSSANFTGSITIKPVPTGTRIMLRQTVLTGGNTFWFSYANGVDGAC